MKNFVVDFKTLTRAERVVMSEKDILADSQLGKHAHTILESRGEVVGMTVDTESYGKVEINLEGFEPKKG